MKNLFAKVITIVIIVALFFTINETIGIQFYNNKMMVASYYNKAERAKSIDGRKLLIFGGSAVNLGFDSEYFESLSGIPCVNMGITAGVPLEAYFGMAEKYAKPDDTVIFALETSYYTTSVNDVDESCLDINRIDNTLIKSNNESIIKMIDWNSKEFLRSFGRLNDVAHFYAYEFLSSDNSGSIYVAGSTNEYGDFVLHKGLPPTYKRAIKHSDFKYNQKTLEYISEKIEELRNKGINVIFSFSPIDGKTYSDYEGFFSDVDKMVDDYIDKDIVAGSAFDFIYDEDFFYDTLNHTIYENKKIYTKDLYLKIKEKGML